MPLNGRRPRKTAPARSLPSTRIEICPRSLAQSTFGKHDRQLLPSKQIVDRIGVSNTCSENGPVSSAEIEQLRDDEIVNIGRFGE